MKEKERKQKKENMGTQKQQKTTKENLIAVSIVCLSLLFLSSFAIAIPSGPSAINVTSNTTQALTNGMMVNISGGYVSKVNITATMQNDRWKAFTGWIDGKFTLDDAAGSTIYDWTLPSIDGEVYATRTSGAIDWANIACASAANISAEDTALEHTGQDNISATFSATNTDTFIVAGVTVGAGSCQAINTHVNNASQSADFEEVILYDTSNIIFATILEQDAVGYDGATYDFQMIVPENGNASKSIVTAYYLYVELT